MHLQLSICSCRFEFSLRLTVGACSACEAAEDETSACEQRSTLQREQQSAPKIASDHGEPKA